MSEVRPPPVLTWISWLHKEPHSNGAVFYGAPIRSTLYRNKSSLSQQILYLAKEYLAKRKRIRTTKPPAQVLLELSGSWADDRKAEEIIKEMRKSRRNSQKLGKGW